MARPQYDVEALIANIKRRCCVPTSQLTYEDSDWAAMATDCLQDTVVPLIMSTREQFYVDYVDINSTSGVIPFPEETVGSKVRSICYVQQDAPLLLQNLPMIDLDVVAGVGIAGFNTIAGFYLQDDGFVLYPSSNVPVNTRIRIYYFRRTLTLTDPESYGQVKSIDAMTNSVELDYLPLDWEVGDVVNSISSTPSFKVTSTGAITAVSNPSVVLDSVEGLNIGDYMSLEGFGAIPQIPIEAMGYLAQLTAEMALEGLGDATAAKVAKEKARELKDSLLVMISSRVDGSPKKIINPNGGLRYGAGIGYRNNSPGFY